MDPSTALDRFIAARRVKQKEAFTHTTLNPSGKYFIDDSSSETFMTLLCNCVKKSLVKTITEKPGAYTPLRVDCDFKSSLDVGTKRQYTDEMVKKLISFYQEEIEKIINEDEFTEDMLICVLLEKKNPRVEENVIKDGFHLHFPFFITEAHIFEYLREKVNKRVAETDLWKPLKVLAKHDKLIDERVGTKTWCMYGCAKAPGAMPFLMTKIYDRDLNVLDPEEVFAKQMEGRKSSLTYYLPRFFSIRGYTECTPLKENSSFRAPPRERKRRNKIQMKRDLKDVLEDLKTIKEGQIMEMLKDETADNYHDWMDVGWTLFNIGQGHEDFLELWIDFSKRSSKYKDGECDKIWYEQMELRGKTMGSLLSMAKRDNPDAYKQWTDTNINFLLYRSLLEKKPNEYDVSKVIYRMYQGRFTCAHPKKDQWFEFKNHRWFFMNDGVSIKKLMAEEVVNLYWSFKAQLAVNAVAADDTERSKLKTQQDKCDAIITGLKTVKFQKAVLDMCKLQFYDPEFYKKLDQNSKLWVFTNGVYDLDQGYFREGRPDDYCSFCCGHAYNNYTEQDDEIQDIDEYLLKVFPNENIRNYMLGMLCLAIGGKNVHKKFGCCTGVGDNAKSVTFALILHAFGDYAITFPREMITKGANSSSGPRPELARIRGRRLAVLSELGKAEKMNVGILKELTGNDAFFARTLNEEGSDIKPMFTLFLQCNELPDIPGHDEATWNRVRVILFSSRFNNAAPQNEEEQRRKSHFKADPYIKDRFDDLAPALLWRIFQKYAEFKKQGLAEPIEVQAATEKYRTEHDIYREFISDRIERVTRDKKSEEYTKNCISVSQMYAEFKDWYEENHPSYSRTEKIGKSTMRNEIVKRMGALGEKNKWYGFRFIQEESDGVDPFAQTS